ncbi:MAG: hypothetical protein DRP47_10690, partial [Candidatus Zixiibacteriota bacterium]
MKLFPDSTLSFDENVQNSEGILPLLLGRNEICQLVISDLTRIRSLLVVGGENTSRSKFLQTLILSTILKTKPDALQLILIGSDVQSFSAFRGCRHLSQSIETDPKAAIETLTSVIAEMERRYQLLSDLGVSHIDEYNLQLANLSRGSVDKVRKPLPRVLIAIDELENLMEVDRGMTEKFADIMNHHASSTGLYLVLATQYAECSVVTGIIKAVFSSKIAFKLNERKDSLWILDQSGAEKLSADREMLFLSPEVTS